MMKKLERGQLVFQHLIESGEGLPVRVICDTSQRIVPGQECREQGKKAAGLDDGWVWHPHGVTV